MKIFNMTIAMILAITSGAQAQTTPPPPTVARPPQYVLLAFDGSYNLDMWQDTLNVAHTNSLKFTYFISGVYFVLQEFKKTYIEPTKGAGVSAIGWGGTSKTDLEKRVDYVNEAHDAGHEIGSHANGHFDGSTWTGPQWVSEFQQFYNLIFNVFQINQIGTNPPANPYHFKPSDIVGFRAPLLGRNAAMYSALSQFHFAYDTSKTAAMNYWPENINNIWNFPLADLRIAGTGRKTLSMDYNFYYTQSAGKPDPANYATYHEQMLNTYLNYFKTNYYGNRAPVHIGHHFSKWNGGAYWDALKDFSREVCTMPEVRCVTYRDLLTFMNSLTPQTLTAYRKGDFVKADPSTMPAIFKNIPASLAVDLSMPAQHKNTLKLVTSNLKGTFAQQKTEYAWSVNRKEVLRSNSSDLNLDELSRDVTAGDTLSVSLFIDDKEVQKTSHKVLEFSDTTMTLDPQDLELEVLKGDLPAAHFDESLVNPL